MFQAGKFFGLLLYILSTFTLQLAFCILGLAVNFTALQIKVIAINICYVQDVQPCDSTAALHHLSLAAQYYYNDNRNAAR